MTLVAHVKTLLAGTVEVFRDHADDLRVLPYATILDRVSQVPALEGDARTLADRVVAQVDVWQAAGTETDTLVPAVVAILDAALLPAPWLRLRVLFTARSVEEDGKVIHDAITVTAAALR